MGSCKSFSLGIFSAVDCCGVVGRPSPGQLSSYGVGLLFDVSADATVLQAHQSAPGWTTSVSASSLVFAPCGVDTARALDCLCFPFCWRIESCAGHFAEGWLRSRASRVVYLQHPIAPFTPPVRASFPVELCIAAARPAVVFTFERRSYVWAFPRGARLQFCNGLACRSVATHGGFLFRCSHFLVL